MIPLVGEKKELKFVKDIVVEVAEQVKKEKELRHAVPYRYHDRDPACSSDCRYRSLRKLSSSPSVQTT